MKAYIKWPMTPCMKQKETVAESVLCRFYGLSLNNHTFQSNLDRTYSLNLYAEADNALFLL